MAFEALSQILAICQKESIDFAEAVLREDMQGPARRPRGIDPPDDCHVGKHV